MSRAHKCDRCGTFYEFDYRIYSNNTHFIGCRPQKDLELDLCPMCQKDLDKWFTYPMKVKEKENEQST